MRQVDEVSRDRPVSGWMIRWLMLVTLVMGLTGVAGAQAGATEFDTIRADRAFRDGVLRFHQAQYGEAVFYFQEALNVRPLDRLSQAWLGRAYFHAGFEEASLQEWELLARQGGAGPALNSFMEYIRGRQGLGIQLGEDQQFFPAFTVERTSPVALFRRPSSVLPLADGRNLLASFGTNALAVSDANGRVVQTFRGGLTRLQGPFDMVLAGGTRLFVSQFLSNQIFEMSLDGRVLAKFGEKGLGPGQMNGPQYLATDHRDFLYVTDIGNRRVHKFQLDGTPVLSFGDKSPEFDGLERPTGILWQDEVLYVLDARRRLAPRLLMFDGSGNLLDQVVDERFAGAEALGEFSPGVLVYAAGNRLWYYRLADRSFEVAHASTRPGTRYTKASLDANGNLVSTDFDGERLDILTRLAGQYAGLHVQVQRVYAQNFPNVRVEVMVTDNTGRPMVGLEKGNFVVSEGNRPLNAFSLVSAGWRETQLDTMVVVEGSLRMGDPLNQEAARNSLKDLAAELGAGSRLGLVSAGAQPVLEAPLGSTPRQREDALARMGADLDWSFDRAIRLAVPPLIQAPGLKNLVYVSTGELTEASFASYGIQETLAYLRNNGIRFSVIDVGTMGLDPALDYLVRESGGFVRRLYDPQGLQGFRTSLLAAKDGTYAFTWRSGIDSDFGRKYLPVEVEARLFQKSGRDEAGYFSPPTF